jgi:hypothetical protein
LADLKAQGEAGELIVPSQDEARVPIVPTTLASPQGVKGHRPVVGIRDYKDLLSLRAVIKVVTGVLHANNLGSAADAKWRIGQWATRRLQEAFAVHLRHLGRLDPAARYKRVVLVGCQRRHRPFTPNSSSGLVNESGIQSPHCGRLSDAANLTPSSDRPHLAIPRQLNVDGAVDWDDPQGWLSSLTNIEVRLSWAVGLALSSWIRSRPRFGWPPDREIKKALHDSTRRTGRDGGFCRLSQ